MSQFIDVRTNLRKVLSFTDRFSSQFPFAVASALTGTVREVRDAMPAEAERVFEGGVTPFTRSAFYFTPARKDRLSARVGVKDVQARYLVFQVQGGTRKPKRRALRLPSEVQLDARGNMPAGLVRQLVARAKAGRKATKTQAARFGVSQQLDLFYGDPGDGRPAGVYKRVALPGRDNKLVPIVVFPEQSAQYDRRLDFYGLAEARVRARFVPNLRRAWEQAKATAR